MFLITSTALLAVSVLARSQWLLAVTCLVTGVQIERAGPQAGVVNITFGVLLLLASGKPVAAPHARQAVRRRREGQGGARRAGQAHAGPRGPGPGVSGQAAG